MFGNKVITEIMKLDGVIGVSPDPVFPVSLQKGEIGTQMRMEGRQCEDDPVTTEAESDWTEAAASRGSSRIAGHHKKPGGGKEGLYLESQGERDPASSLVLNF